jgi:hypothetical protein
MFRYSGGCQEENVTWKGHRNYVGHFCITRWTEREREIERATEEVKLLCRRIRYSTVLSSGGKNMFFF